MNLQLTKRDGVGYNPINLGHVSISIIELVDDGLFRFHSHLCVCVSVCGVLVAFIFFSIFSNYYYFLALFLLLVGLVICVIEILRRKRQKEKNNKLLVWFHTYWETCWACRIVISKVWTTFLCQLGLVSI